MKILSVNAGLPVGESYAMWHRVSKINEILTKAGHEVQVIHYWDNKFKRYYFSNYKDEISKFIKNNPDHIFIWGSSIKIFINHLKQISKNYDLIYGNNQKATFYSTIGKIKKIPLIFDRHGDLVAEFLIYQKNPNIKSNLKLLMLKLINYLNLNLSNKIVCVSKTMIKYLIDNQVPKNKLRYVTNGVDINYFKPFSTENIHKNKENLNLEDKMIFGYIGGSHKWQGVENFIKSTKGINDNKLSFMVVGGEERYKSKNLSIFPKIPFENIRKYYSVCDVLVLPRPDHIATQIAAPTKFAEYAAMGKPILTTNVGDAASLVKKYKCGLIVENNEPHNIMKGFNIFKDKSNSEIQKMGINARKLAEVEFDWDRVGQNLIKTINEI